jgi:hypothetical protein
MSIIDKIALDRIVPLSGLNPGELGARVFLGELQVVGIRCVYSPPADFARPGFVPLEGPNKFRFLDAPSAPGLDVSNLTYIALESPALERQRAPSLGDLCVFKGGKDISLAIALADSQGVMGYLMLQGEHMGHVVKGYQVEYYLGKAILLGSVTAPA